MAHFAKLDEHNNVIAVHTVSNDVLIENGVESEQKGIDFLSQLHNHFKWKQTSYNGNIRGRYAGQGDIYDESLDVFLPKKPYNSWILNTELYIWEPPTAKPEDNKLYNWSEENNAWIEVVNNSGVK